MTENKETPHKEDLLLKINLVLKVAWWVLGISGSALITLLTIGVNDHYTVQFHSVQLAQIVENTKGIQQASYDVAYMRPKVEQMWWGEGGNWKASDRPPLRNEP